MNQSVAKDRFYLVEGIPYPNEFCLIRAKLRISRRRATIDINIYLYLTCTWYLHWTCMCRLHITEFSFSQWRKEQREEKTIKYTINGMHRVRHSAANLQRENKIESFQKSESCFLSLFICQHIKYAIPIYLVISNEKKNCVVLLFRQWTHISMVQRTDD